MPSIKTLLITGVLHILLGIAVFDVLPNHAAGFIMLGCLWFLMTSIAILLNLDND